MPKKNIKTIGIDARMYTQDCTGISRYLRELTSELFEIDKNNHYIMFMLEPEYSCFNPPNERVKKIKLNSCWYGYKEQLILPWQILRANCDLVHFPNFNTPFFYPKKSIVTIHDITPFYFSGHRRKSKFRDLAFRQIFNQSAKRAKKVIAVSASTKNDIINHFKINPEKIEVIYNGLSQNFLKTFSESEITSLKAKYKIKPPFILYIGVWRNHKNVIGLLKAFKILLSKYHLPCQLVLAGKELPQYPEIRNTWQKFKLEKNLVFPGFINENELPIFYRASRLLVIPSFAEGFGLTGIESLACGTPVAASDIPALKEVLGDAASYFNPYKPEEMAKIIYQLFTDNNLRVSELAEAKKKLAKYNWQITAQKTLKLYSKVLENQKP